MVRPAITDLRVFQWGKETVNAFNTLTVDTLPTVGDTITLNGVLYSVVASGAIAGQINVGINLAAFQTNFVAAVNGTDSINTPNAYVTAGAFAANVSRITARLSGTDGNAFTTTETFTAVTNIFSAGVLSGGLSAGVAVPATSRMLVADLDLEPTDQVYHPPLLRGLIQRYKGLEIVIERGTNFNIPDSTAFFEQIPNWLSMSVRGGVRPSGSGPYTYDFTRDPTQHPDLDTWTLERRLSDGVNHLDRETAYAFLRNIVFSGAQNQPVMFSAQGSARRIQNSTMTAAITAPTAEAMLSSSSALYIDSTWGAIGGTQILGQILNWEISWQTGYAPLFTIDGRSDLDFTVPAISSENTQLMLRVTMLVKPLNGQFATEQTAAEAQTARAVRVEISGTSSRRVRFDMLVKHNLGSLFKVGEFEGQDIVEMELVETTDGSNLFRVEVVNNVAVMV